MGLMDKIRQAEEHGREKARSAYGFARDLQEDMQRRLRQKMRVYPRPGAVSAADSASDEFTHTAPDNGGVLPSEVSQAAPAGESPMLDEMEDVKNLEAEPTQPIVSIHGKDVAAEFGRVSRKKPGSSRAGRERGKQEPGRSRREVA